MRDSLALRQRLLSLACLPALALALGCSGSDPGAAKADAKKADAKKARDGKGADGKGADGKGPKTSDDKKATLAKRGDPKLARAADAKADAGPKATGPVGDDAIEPSSAKPGHGQPPPEPGTDPRYLPVPGDPPYVDGYNPEEETCPSGNYYDCKAQSIGARSQSARTYLEKHLDEFAACSLEALAVHALTALRDSLGNNDTTGLTVDNVSLALLGKDLPYREIDGAELDAYLRQVPEKERTSLTPPAAAAAAAAAAMDVE